MKSKIANSLPKNHLQPSLDNNTKLMNKRVKDKGRISQSSLARFIDNITEGNQNTKELSLPCTKCNDLYWQVSIIDQQIIILSQNLY